MKFEVKVIFKVDYDKKINASDYVKKFFSDIDGQIIRFGDEGKTTINLKSIKVKQYASD